MTQQIDTNIVKALQAVGEPGFIDPRMAGAAPDCPECGTACAHSDQEKQGFALDALQQASEGQARDEAACRRANQADRVRAGLDQPAPPTNYIGMANDETIQEWLRQIADGSTPPKMRKSYVRSLRAAMKACAEEQRSTSKAEMARAVAEGKWLSVTAGLPAPYEEVRILTDGLVRIARLAHDKSYFQLATFLADTKHQYVVKLDAVQGWQPLIAALGSDAPVVSMTAGA